MNPIRRGPAALIRTVAFGGVFAGLSLSSAQADCPLWNLNGDLRIAQSNQTWPTFSFQQTGTKLKGTGEFTAKPKGYDYWWHYSASVDGVIDGNSVEFTAYWAHDEIGFYTGTISANGRIKGTTYERRSPDEIVTWYSERIVECLAASGSALTVEDPNAVKPQGRVKTGTSGPPLEICEAARQAGLRNSPAAPGLAAKCLAAGGGEVTGETTE